MAFEIDMLSVGVATSQIIRYIPQSTNYEVVILIDAGNSGDGPKIVNHINKYTRQKYIDLAICTHPDSDHIGGFPYVVENMRIEEFWIHDPNLHKTNVSEIRDVIEKNNLEKSLRYLFESLGRSESLLDLIDRKGILRIEPFTGLTYELAPITIVGPTESYYEQKLSHFRDIRKLFEEEASIEKSIKGGLISLTTLSPEEIIDQDNDRSNENNSSAIVLFTPEEDRKFLFTADAGPEALIQAKGSYDLSNLEWLAVPHHGSRYSLTSSLIKHFKPKIAYISADGSEHYPNAAIVKALKNSHAKVFSTHLSNNLLFKSGLSARLGYIPTSEIP